MKKIIFLFAGLMALGTVALAQHQKRGEHRKGGKKALQELNLTEGQQAQMRSLGKEYKEKMNSLQRNDQITVKEFRLKKDALRKEKKEKFQALLTGEQKNKLTEMRRQKSEQRAKKQEERLTKLQTRLKLSEAQVSRLKSQRESLKKEALTLKQNEQLTSFEKKEKLKALKQKNKDSFIALLNNEQKQELEKMKKNRHHRKFSAK